MPLTMTSESAVRRLAGASGNPQEAAELPKPEEVQVNAVRGEILFCATVQHPRNKPCIDTWGERYQAFLGTSKCSGKPAQFSDYFVFLSQADVEDVYKGLLELGAETRVHYSCKEAKKVSGREYLAGDPVVISIFWDEEGRRVERAYDDFVQERRESGGTDEVKPWTPHWVFHGSGVIHDERTGCIACPCDCPGGIIADNRTPIYRPMPTVRFDWSKAPPTGTTVYVRIRPVSNRS